MISHVVSTLILENSGLNTDQNKKCFLSNSAENCGKSQTVQNKKQINHVLFTRVTKTCMMKLHVPVVWCHVIIKIKVSPKTADFYFYRFLCYWHKSCHHVGHFFKFIHNFNLNRKPVNTIADCQNKSICRTTGRSPAVAPSLFVPLPLPLPVPHSLPLTAWGTSLAFALPLTLTPAADHGLRSSQEVVHTHVIVVLHDGKKNMLC